MVQRTLSNGKGLLPLPHRDAIANPNLFFIVIADHPQGISPAITGETGFYYF